ncbi:methyltransferase domain-containing protein [Amycolatopsis sp. SID8362]|uniref:methyltransferase domain-containing protein n=1 Tax=Amycolatopsis sp. SID8362 TaxID=2690346 RepID=UPI00136E31BA|nr:methyltransferase domain-containing protein [Amycolatopsis sp. SID8362]NBH03480.1 methyltransferase domain-containing protein [Amycolatopsis sp. SID8362]NED40180.1 methyltransferase domain-containing protein [Amycolatopsis sp. SID8362]
MSSTTTAQPDDATEALIRLLDVADTLPGAAELRAHTYDLLRLDEGRHVVDVGCGAGRAVAELATRGSRPIGVDPDSRMLAAARRRWPEHDFREGVAAELPLDDGSVAGYRADKVFHELADPAAALAEARRVLEPGGWIVLIGQDWDTFVIDSDDPELTRTIVHARAGTVPSPRAARGYRTLLLDAGFEDVTVEVRTAILTDRLMLPVLAGLAAAASAAGSVERDQAETWLAEQTRRAESDRMFLALPLFIAAGVSPKR